MSALGAAEVIDYRGVDFATVVCDVDVVLETVGGDNTARSLRVLRPGGVLVYLPGRPDPALYEEAAALGVRLVVMSVEPDYRSLDQLTELIDAGALRPYVSHTLPLAEAGKAHLLFADGVQGKVVLVP